jgi:hypothetical protein
MIMIKDNEIETLYKTLNPLLDKTNIIMLEEERLAKLLDNFLFLQQYAKAIISNSSFTYEEVLYSQYYWFIQFKDQYSAKEGYDGGMEQQAFKLLENLCNELDGNVDWELIESISKAGNPE